MKNKEEIFHLCDEVRERAFALHSYLRHGHPEKIYEATFEVPESNMDC